GRTTDSARECSRRVAVWTARLRIKPRLRIRFADLNSHSWHSRAGRDTTGHGRGAIRPAVPGGGPGARPWRIRTSLEVEVKVVTGKDRRRQLAREHYQRQLKARAERQRRARRRAIIGTTATVVRSEERRVGKEGRWRSA